MTTIQTIELGGQSLVIMTREDYECLVDAAGKKKKVSAKEALRLAIARDILLARRQAKMSQTDLAKASGVRQETISRLEAGKHEPNEKTIRKLMNAIEKFRA